MADFEWPDDPEFRRFAGRVADAVTVAINSGVTIGTPLGEDGCRCPLGCANLECEPHPKGSVASRRFGIAPGQAWDFINGFDGGHFGEPYGALGAAYRHRFVDGVR